MNPIDIIFEQWKDNMSHSVQKYPEEDAFPDSLKDTILSIDNASSPIMFRSKRFLQSKWNKIYVFAQSICSSLFYKHSVFGMVNYHLGYGYLDGLCPYKASKKIGAGSYIRKSTIGAKHSTTGMGFHTSLLFLWLASQIIISLRASGCLSSCALFLPKALLIRHSSKHAKEALPALKEGASPHIDRMSMCKNGHTVFLLATAMKTISCLQNGTMWWKGRIPVSPIHSPFLWFYLLIPLPSCWQKMEAWFLASFLIPSPFQRSSTIHSCSCNSIGRCITFILSSNPNPLASSSTWSRWAFLTCPLRNVTSTDYPFWNGCSLRLVIRSHHAKSSTSTQTSSSVPSFLKCHIDCTPSSMGRMSYPLSPLTSSTYSLPTCTARKMCLI